MKLKKIICAILAIMTLALCCVGCGKSGSESSIPETANVASEVNATYTDMFFVTKGVIAFKTAENRIGLVGTGLKELVKAEYTDVKYCEANGVCILTKADGTQVSYDIESGKFTDAVCAHGGYEPILWDAASKAPVLPDGSALSKSDYPEKGQSTLVYDSAAGKYGIMDSDGKLITEPIYEAARDFVGGVAAVKKDGFWGYVTMEGKEIVGFYYSDAYESVSCMTSGNTAFDMYNGEVAVNREGFMSGIFNQKSDMICKFVYREIIPFGDGTYVARYSDGKWFFGTAKALNDREQK